MQDVTGDGRVVKRTLKQGTGKVPTKGEKVWCHYTGKLADGSGTVFDTSIGKPHRKNGFDFVLGEGQVIEAWDIGVATMKVGEKAILKCDPSVAYGAEGTPGGPIPPNAELIFEVELLGVGNAPPVAKDEIIFTQHK